MNKEIWIVFAFNQQYMNLLQGKEPVSKITSTKPGFFFKKEDAVYAALENANDLCEGQMNRYAIVYPIQEGIDMHCKDFEREQWFEYVSETDKYKKIPRIHLAQVVFGFE